MFVTLSVGLSEFTRCSDTQKGFMKGSMNSHKLFNKPFAGLLFYGFFLQWRPSQT
jgi:hypothetical protein